MRLIDHQHRLKLLRQRRQWLQRREIAIHAVHGFHRDQQTPGAAGSRCANAIGNGLQVIVPGAKPRCVASANPFFDADMNALVEHNGIMSARQAAEDREIRDKAAAEEQCTFGGEEARREFFELRMFVTMPAQQPRGSGANRSIL